MSNRLLVEANEWDGIHEYAHFDNDGNFIGLQRVTDHTPILEYNKARQNDGTKGYGESKEWKHVARISPAMLIQWAHDKGVSFDFISSQEGFNEIVLKMIKDPDYRHLRVDG